MLDCFFCAIGCAQGPKVLLVKDLDMKEDYRQVLESPDRSLCSEGLLRWPGPSMKGYLWSADRKAGGMFRKYTLPRRLLRHTQRY